MKEYLKLEIENRWKITDAFVKGIANENDINVWLSKCFKSSFHTAFPTFSTIDKTYIGMLDDVNFFTDNCSVEGMIEYIYFYENQANKKWKDLYLSSVNTHKKRTLHKDERDTNWWKNHLKDLS